MTYSDGLMIRRNPHFGKINYFEFCKHLEQAKNIAKKVSMPGSTQDAPRKSPKGHGRNANLLCLKNPRGY